MFVSSPIRRHLIAGQNVQLAESSLIKAEPKSIGRMVDKLAREESIQAIKTDPFAKKRVRSGQYFRRVSISCLSSPFWILSNCSSN